MQAVIDAILEIVSDRIGYFDRGDPLNYDFTLADLLMGGAWHDLDLSGIVPANARAVLFNVQCINNVINKQFRFRQNGNVNPRNVRGLRSQVAGLLYMDSFVVACDSNRVIEYSMQGFTWTYVDFTVCGWWLR